MSYKKAPSIKHQQDTWTREHLRETAYIHAEKQWQFLSPKAKEEFEKLLAAHNRAMGVKFTNSKKNL